MKKLNNNGMSLMELLISIILVSIVLVFLFQLLTDLKDEQNNKDFTYNNQINRTEVIKTIEEDLQKYDLIGIKDNTTDNLNISFDYNYSNSIKSAILTSKKKNVSDTPVYTITYTNVLGEKTTWTMKDAEIDSCYDFTFYNDNIVNNYYIKIIIPIYNYPYNEKNCQKQNNPVDDIEIVYATNNSLLKEDNKYLTIYNNSNKTINACTK